jgi:hypothetical protein
MAVRFTATGCGAQTTLSDGWVCLLADNIRNEVVSVTHITGDVVLQILSLCTLTFVAPTEQVLIYPLKLLCRNIYNFSYEYFLLDLPFEGYCCKLWPSNNTRRKKSQGLRSDERGEQVPLLIIVFPNTSNRACIDIHAVLAVAESCRRHS